jgi:hypothetical protein
MNPPAAGKFKERSKMMSEVGRPETEAKKNKKLKLGIRNMYISSFFRNKIHRINLADPGEMARQNSGAGQDGGQPALFWLDFSLFRFFSSKEKK